MYFSPPNLKTWLRACSNTHSQQVIGEARNEFLICISVDYTWASCQFGLYSSISSCRSEGQSLV